MLSANENFPPLTKLFPRSLILWVASDIFCLQYLLPYLDCIMTSFIIQPKLKRSIPNKIWSIWIRQRSNQLRYKINCQRQQWDIKGAGLTQGKRTIPFTDMNPRLPDNQTPLPWFSLWHPMNSTVQLFLTALCPPSVLFAFVIVMCFQTSAVLTYSSVLQQSFIMVQYLVAIDFFDVHGDIFVEIWS